MLDLGANIGAVSSAFLARGVAHVVAVEPEPRNFELLLRNTASHHERVTALRRRSAPTLMRLLASQGFTAREPPELETPTTTFALWLR